MLHGSQVPASDAHLETHQTPAAPSAEISSSTADASSNHPSSLELCPQPAPLEVSVAANPPQHGGQSSLPRADDVQIPQPSLEELRSRVQATVAQRAASRTAHAEPKQTSVSQTPETAGTSTKPVFSSSSSSSSSSPSSSNSSSGDDSQSDSDSDSSHSGKGDYASLLRRRAQLARLLAEAQEQGQSDDSESEPDADMPDASAGHLPDSDDDDEKNLIAGNAGGAGGAAHALFQGPATKNQVVPPPEEGPSPPPLPSGMKPGDKIPTDGLHYLGKVQGVIDGAVMVVQQDVPGGGGALPRQRPGQEAYPYGGRISTSGPHAEVYAVLDTGSTLTLEDGTVVGTVFETFGSLQIPFYSILLPQESGREIHKSEPLANAQEKPQDTSQTGAPDQPLVNEVGRVHTGRDETGDEHCKRSTDMPGAVQASIPTSLSGSPTPKKEHQTETISADGAKQAEMQDVSAPESRDDKSTLPASASISQPPESTTVAPAPSPDTSTTFRAAHLREGTKIYFDTRTCSIVETASLKLLPKGSDASNLHDEEVNEEEQEYSDDEAEQEAKRARKAASKRMRKTPAASQADPYEASRRTYPYVQANMREYSLPGQLGTFNSGTEEARGHGRGRGQGRGRGRGRGQGRGHGAAAINPPFPGATVHPVPGAAGATAGGYALSPAMVQGYSPAHPPAAYGYATPGIPAAPAQAQAQSYWPPFWPPAAPGTQQSGMQSPMASWAVRLPPSTEEYNPAQPGYHPTQEN